MASRQVINISKRLKLIRPSSRDSWPWSVDPNRVLVLLFPWLNSKEKHIRKYTDIYSDLGLDVLSMRSNLTDFLWPPESMKAGRSLVKVLEEQCKDYDHFCVHAFSVGAYNLTSFRMLVNEQESTRYLLDRISCLIYDSVVLGGGKGGIIKDTEDREKSADGIELMVTGMATSVTDNKLFFNVLNSLTKIYFALTKSTTLDFYAKSYDVVRDEPPKVPTLFMASEDDPMSDHKIIRQLADLWRKDHSMPVRTQIWEKSGHAQHLALHTKEYLDVQRQFLADVFGKSKA